MARKFTWMIGGPQGMGVDTSANAFARAIALAGFEVFGKREYHSNIKGEHSYFVVTFSEGEVGAHSDKADILVSFERRTLEIHVPDLPDGAVVILDEKDLQILPYLTKKDVVPVPVPYEKILSEVSEKFGIKEKSKLEIMRNSISVFSSWAVLGLDTSYLEEAMKFIFTGRRAKVLEPNRWAGLRAWEHVRKMEIPFPKSFRKLSPLKKEKRFLLTGTQAVAFGKVLAGCRFQTYYPITPATDESEFLEELSPKYGIVVVQTEDEISAITMATGAALAGARASTSTSGPGFSLMAEGLGWAGMNEVPVVVVDWQRAGPSTGLPTRHEQADLHFAIHAGHGEFPRIVLSPGDIQEAFWLAFHSFNLAERYQCPVILLADKNIANSVKTVKLPDFENLKIDRGELWGLHDGKANDVGNDRKKADNLGDDGKKVNELGNDGKTNGNYRRFEITPSGISPRAFLGQDGVVFWNTGDEHDEFGHISEDPQNRLKMHDKRMRKLLLAQSEISDDIAFSFYGNDSARFVVVSWGSTKGAILDAIGNLQTNDIAFLQIRLLHPFPKKVAKFLEGKTVIVVEMNWMGQLAGLLREHTLKEPDFLVLKWTGRSMSSDELEEVFLKILEGKAERREVLSYGR